MMKKLIVTMILISSFVINLNAQNQSQSSDSSAAQVDEMDTKNMATTANKTILFLIIGSFLFCE